jgi:hypothetical protein
MLLVLFAVWQMPMKSAHIGENQLWVERVK